MSIIGISNMGYKTYAQVGDSIVDCSEGLKEIEYFKSPRVAEYLTIIADEVINGENDAVCPKGLFGVPFYHGRRNGYLKKLRRLERKLKMLKKTNNIFYSIDWANGNDYGVETTYQKHEGKLLIINERLIHKEEVKNN